MFKQLKELYSLLTDEQRKKLRRLQILVVLMAFAELGSVFSMFTIWRRSKYGDRIAEFKRHH